MAVDIAPELYEEIQRRFQEKMNKAERSGSHIMDIRKKLDAGTATFRDADMYAVEVGNLLSESMMEVLKLDDMPNGQLYYNIAKRTLGQSLQDTYGLVSSVAAEVQEELNAANGIGLKAITPEANKERINGLVDKAVEAPDQDTLNRILQSPVENLVMSAVDDTVKANAEYQSKAGLQPIIKRSVLSKCCDWCSALAGTYKYPNDVPEDVYRRHQNCRCTVEYIGAGKRQDVWSKKEYDSQRDARIAKTEKIAEEIKIDRNASEDRRRIAEEIKKESFREFHCFGDYLYDVLGSARENNKQELQEIIDIVEAKGGRISFNNNPNKMVTNVRKGEPATIDIYKDASIGACRHELRHFLDDLENGCPGLAHYLKDKDVYFEYEKRGYEEELELAQSLGYNNIVKKIQAEIMKRKEEIYGHK